jgi:hypothetical protein
MNKQPKKQNNQSLKPKFNKKNDKKNDPKILMLIKLEGLNLKLFKLLAFKLA